MTIETLTKKVSKLEKELAKIKYPEKILGKVFVDEKMLNKANKALFDFDIEKFITQRDLKLWK